MSPRVVPLRSITRLARDGLVAVILVRVWAGGKVYPPVFVGGGGGSFLEGLVAFWRRLFTDFVSALRVDLISLISSSW